MDKYFPNNLLMEFRAANRGYIFIKIVFLRDRKEAELG